MMTNLHKKALKTHSLSSLKRLFSSNKKSLLTSDFISDRLYDKKEGYFSKKDAQLGFLEEPIIFSELFGYEDYMDILYKRYPKNAWLTPSEIFKPWYGMTIANYICKTFEKAKKMTLSRDTQPLKIIEVGAGNGSAASSILDYIKTFHPLKYKTMEYTVIEISKEMIARSKKNLSKNHQSKINSNHIKFEHQSIVEYSSYTKDFTFVLFLEVFDNMPHDRVYLVRT